MKKIFLKILSNEENIPYSGNASKTLDWIFQE